MALADFDAYKTAPSQRISVTKSSHSQSHQRTHSFWTNNPLPGAAPSTAIAPDRTTTGALGQANPASGSLYLRRLSWAGSVGIGNTFGTRGTLMLCDRLSHQGGLSGTTTGAQTTNLPTAALTRYTSGVGVMAALEIYSAVGTTATTVTVSYTNQNGDSGQTSKATVFGGSTLSVARTFLILSPQDGDTGFRSVESVTLAASTVSAAGNFGVTLFKPLMSFSMRASEYAMFDTVLGNGGVMPPIVNDACLWWVGTGNSSNASTILQLSCDFIEA